MTKKENKKTGRPAFAVTDLNKKIVYKMSSMGIPQEQIAGTIGCSVDTLAKYFKEELVSGKGDANFNVAQSLYNQAVKGNVGAAIFWMKTQAKWKETEKIEITGKDDGPVEIGEAKAKLLAGIVVNKDKKD